LLFQFFDQLPFALSGWSAFRSAKREPFRCSLVSISVFLAVTQGNVFLSFFLNLTLEEVLLSDRFPFYASPRPSQSAEAPHPSVIVVANSGALDIEWSTFF